MKKAGFITGLSQSQKRFLSRPAQIKKTVPEKPPAFLRGERPVAITARKLEVLTLISKGHTAAEVGEMLFISPKCVHWHLRDLYRTLGARNAIHGLRLALLQGHGHCLGLLPFQEEKADC